MLRIFIRKSRFSTSDRHKIDDKYVFCIILMQFYEIFSFWHFHGTGRIFYFFTPKFLFSRVGFGGKFHGDCWFFTGSFQEIFTGRKIFSRPEIQKFSREGFFFSRGKKKALVLHVDWDTFSSDSSWTPKSQLNEAKLPFGWVFGVQLGLR